MLEVCFFLRSKPIVFSRLYSYLTHWKQTHVFMVQTDFNTGFLHVFQTPLSLSSLYPYVLL